MPRDVKKYLWDMQQACVLLKAFAQGRAREDYDSDAMFRSAVERQFTVIGEAAFQMRKIAPWMTERLPQLDRIIGFRHRLIHAYADTTDEVVWRALQDDVPTLYKQVSTLLSEPEQDRNSND